MGSMIECSQFECQGFLPVTKPDLDSKAHIRDFIESFYSKVLCDDLLAPIFIEVAGIDVKVHIPIICSYWEKLLLGDTTYKRHTMNIHRQLHAKFPLTEAAFDRWLALFTQTARENYEGPLTERAIKVATSIAFNMDVQLNKKLNVQTQRL